MSMICVACGNRQFFDTEAETMIELNVTEKGLLIKSAKANEWEYAENNVRDQVREAILSTEKMDAHELRTDPGSGDLFNPYLCCAVCSSGYVCRCISHWYPKKSTVSLEQEITNNRQMLANLRKEKKDNENILPILWQP